MHRPEYYVIAGNVGYVHSGTNLYLAKHAFKMYVELSKQGYGRVASEPVTLLKGEEVIKEYFPTEQLDG